MSALNRPTFSRRLFVLASALMLTGCGWHLRGRQTLPFESIYLALPENSAIGATIARNLRAQTNLTVVDSRDEADAVFELLGQNRSRSVIAYNSEGQARIYSLRLTANFKVTDQNGRDILPPTSITATRDMDWDEGDYNGQAQEERLLYEEMESSVIHQIVLRMSHISPERVKGNNG